MRGCGCWNLVLRSVRLEAAVVGLSMCVAVGAGT